MFILHVRRCLSLFSVWHILMAASLLFLVPRCKLSSKSWKPDSDDVICDTDDVDVDVGGAGEVNDGISLSENSSQSTSRGIPSTESSDTVSSIHSLQVESPAEAQQDDDDQQRQQPPLQRDVNTNV